MPDTNFGNREVLDFSFFKAIQNGGYNLYLRHGERENKSEGRVDFKDCTTQSNLTKKGKEQAIQIGEIFKKKNLPIQYPVYTSPYCRTKDTGKLAFEERNIEVITELADINYLNIDNLNEEQKIVKEKLIRLFETIPNTALNRIFIAHNHTFNKYIQCPDNNGSGLCFLDTIILQPKGEGKGYEFIGLISLDQFIKWSDDKNHE
ncbi:histidine phosphatase family protein [Bacillus thuringiensis]|uniref:histidine phosphatase family protein n=1 Tax=Bacillus thuringiensis TaxID=1428 RepID=UPI00224932E3|nr:histidine phosphatase family protein [Bacillus thuringiensis]